MLKQELINKNIIIDTTKKFNENIRSSRVLGVVFIAFISFNPWFFIPGVIFIGRTILLQLKKKRVLNYRRVEV